MASTKTSTSAPIPNSVALLLHAALNLLQNYDSTSPMTVSESTRSCQVGPPSSLQETQSAPTEDVEVDSSPTIYEQQDSSTRAIGDKEDVFVLLEALQGWEGDAENCDKVLKGLAGVSRR